MTARQANLIGKTGTAYLKLEDVMDLALLRVAELNKKKKHQHYQEMSVDERVILFFAEQLEMYLSMVDDVKTDRVYDRIADIADENERRALTAELRLKDIGKLLEKYGMNAKRDPLEFLESRLGDLPMRKRGRRRKSATEPL